MRGGEGEHSAGVELRAEVERGEEVHTLSLDRIEERKLASIKTLKQGVA